MRWGSALIRLRRCTRQPGHGIGLEGALAKMHKPAPPWDSRTAQSLPGDHLGVVRSAPRARLALMIVSLLSCAPKASWKPTQLQPESFHEGKWPARATVVLVTGESLLVEKPVLSRDSLIWVRPHGSRQTGVSVDRRSDGDSNERYAVPTSAIKAILIKQEPSLGAGRVIFVLVWTTAAVMGVLLLRHGIP